MFVDVDEDVEMGAALCSCFTVLDVPVSQSSHRGI